MLDSSTSESAACAAAYCRFASVERLDCGRPAAFSAGASGGLEAACRGGCDCDCKYRGTRTRSDTGRKTRCGDRELPAARWELNRLYKGDGA
jgi:hypothetical protein